MIDNGKVHKFSGVRVYDSDENNVIIPQTEQMLSLCKKGEVIYKQLTYDNWKVSCEECKEVLIDMGQSLEVRDEGV